VGGETDNLSETISQEVVKPETREERREREESTPFIDGAL
jgi:hypothetical protein